jgi:DNA-directed RNA polymerase
MKSLVKAGTKYTKTPDGIKLVSSRRSDTSESDLIEAEEQEPALEEEDDDEAAETRKRKTKKAATKTKTFISGAGKFINVVDLLPPLPQKGTFEVQEIKASPYFFS